MKMSSLTKRRMAFLILHGFFRSVGLAGFEPALPCPLLQQVGHGTKQNIKPASAGLIGPASAFFQSDIWLKPGQGRAC
jgi:hypothetical protein